MLLELNGAFFRCLVESLNVGVIVVDREGTVIYVNPAYESFLGEPKDNIVAKHITEVVEAPGIHITAKTGKAELGVWMKTRGQYFYTYRIPLKFDGEIKAAMAVIAFERPDQINTILERLKVTEAKLSFYERKYGENFKINYTFDNIIGQSRVIIDTINLAIKASRSDSNVLLAGETGVGKEVFASAIHSASDRGNGPFVKVNCAAIPSQLLESELFGYEGGAFTGASSKGKKGKFELANNGTILLDEIGDLPLLMQPKLLRVLQEKEFYKVGGNKPIPINTRVIAATNKDLESMVLKGRFRSDLFYRLNVIVIKIPPLRERKEDIPIFIEQFLKEKCDKLGIQLKKISKQALDKLMEYSWPGNVRELANIIERLVNYVEGNLITSDDVLSIMGNKLHSISFEDSKLTKLDEIINYVERKVIANTIEECGGNKSKAADRLGIHRTTLYEKMKKLKI